MDLLILLVFLGLVGLFSVWLDRRWQRRRLSPQAEQPAVYPTALAGTNDQHTTLVDQIKAGWHKRLGWRTQPDTESPKLRTWLTTHLADQPPTQRWIAGLTDAEFSALRQQLQAFCAGLQIDLAWLGEPPLAQDPPLQTGVQTSVLHYVQAQHGATSVQAELHAFKTWLALEQRPYSYEHQPLIQQLYTQLVKARLARPVRPEALLASEKVRVEQMLRAIQAAAAADRPAFYRVVNALNTPAQQAEAASPLAAATPARQPPTLS